MNDFIHKIFISLLTSFSILYLAVNSQAQSNCPTSVIGNLTNGVTADLIIGADGVSLLGIRVMWSIKPEYLGCQFTTLRVELNNGEFVKDINATDRSADFFSNRLDCNRQYRPRVRAVLSGRFRTDYGSMVFYGGSKRAPPSQLLRVCVGPPTSQADRTRGRVNISWDPLPCHLQNGADITGYIIQYTRLSTGEATNISSFNTRLICRQESGGPYSCLAASSLFIPRVIYSFQVAAQNVYSVGSFSDPIIATIGSLDTSCTETENVGPATKAALKGTMTNSTSFFSTTTNIAEMTIFQHCTCQEVDKVWALMGILVAITAVLAGMVTTSLLIVNCVLWKRLSKVKNWKQALHDKSGDIDMKECSAYGKVISPQAVTAAGQQHIYESTT